MSKISPSMLSALRKIKEESPDGAPIDDLVGPTPGTLRAMERLGLITCSRFYACMDVVLTDAGRALAEL